MSHSTNIFSEEITMWAANPVLYTDKTPFKLVRVLLVLELPDWYPNVVRFTVWSVSQSFQQKNRTLRDPNPVKMSTWADYLRPKWFTRAEAKSAIKIIDIAFLKSQPRNINIKLSSYYWTLFIAALSELTSYRFSTTARVSIPQCQFLCFISPYVKEA